VFLGPVGDEAHAGGILIVAPSWIGDTVMMQPLLARLREQRPDVEIDALAAPWSAPLLERMPEIHRIIDSPFQHGRFDLAARWRLGRQLAAMGYEQAFVLPNSWKSALPVWFAGIAKRSGFTGEARAGLLNDRRRLDANATPLLVERYATLAEPPDSPLPRPLPTPRLTSSKVQQQAALTALGLPNDEPGIVFCPGAEYGPAKRWPATHFARLAELMGGPVWLLGSAKDAPIGAEIERLSAGHARNLCGKTTLEQAIDVIASARGVVSNDSGLMHIAAALDRPLAAIFGSSSPGYTPPLSPQARIISLRLECSPCFRRECPLGHLRCLVDLSPEQVAATLDPLT
jgi:heptosyltransferase-2